MTDESEKPQADATAKPAEQATATPKEPVNLESVVAGLKTEQEPAKDPTKGQPQREKPTSLADLDPDAQEVAKREIARAITNAKQAWDERHQAELATESDANRREPALSQSAEDRPLTAREVQDMMARQRQADVQTEQRKANIRELAAQAQLTAEQQQEFAAFITECAKNPEKHGFDPALALLNPTSTLAMARASGVLSPKAQGPGGPGDSSAMFAEPSPHVIAQDNAIDAFNKKMYGDLPQSRSMAEMEIKAKARKAIIEQLGEGPVAGM